MAARFLTRVDGRNAPVQQLFQVGMNQTINLNDMVMIDPVTKYLILATTDSTTLVGSCAQAITTGPVIDPAAVIPVRMFYDSIFRIDYSTAGAKTSFDNTDKYITKFNLLNEEQIDPDNTVDGQFIVLAFDNVNFTVDCYASINLLKRSD
jgi:Na+/H+-translocating membrane pyrophosphatase